MCACVSQELVCDFPPLKSLVLVLRSLLCEKKLDNAYTGGITCFGLVLLVTRYLQHVNQQSLTDTPLHSASPSTGELLEGFLDFFGSRFDPHTQGISIEPEVAQQVIMLFWCCLILLSGVDKYARAEYLFKSKGAQQVGMLVWCVLFCHLTTLDAYMQGGRAKRLDLFYECFCHYVAINFGRAWCRKDGRKWNEGFLGHVTFLKCLSSA